MATVGPDKTTWRSMALHHRKEDELNTRTLRILRLVPALAILGASIAARAENCSQETGAGRLREVPCDASSGHSPSLHADKAASPPRSSDLTAMGASSDDREQQPTAGDPKGPRATWKRLGEALKRGDKEAALSELDYPARQKLGPVFEQLLAASGSFDLAQLGEIASIRFAGPELASMELVRKKDGLSQAFPVLMVRSKNGRWLISDM